MNLMAWLEPEFCLRLTWTLLHFLWQGVAIAALVMSVDWSLRGAAANLRYSIHVSALVLMAACLPITLDMATANSVDEKPLGDSAKALKDDQRVSAATKDPRSKQSQELRPFTPEGSGFTFATAGGREPVTVAYQRGEGETAAKGRLFCFDQPHCRCQVRYVDLPDSASGLSLLEVLNKYGFAAWSEKGKYKKEKAVTTGKHQGEEYTVVGLPTGPIKYSHVRVQMFVAANRAFFVSASCPDKRKADAAPEIKAFLDSFRIPEEESNKTDEGKSEDARSNTQFLIDALRAANNATEGKVSETDDSVEPRAQLQDVSIRIIGGKEKEPLRSMTVKANRKRGEDTAVSGLTDMNGNVALKLRPGDYYIELQPKEEVPYLGLPIGYEGYPGHYRRWIRVTDQRDSQHFTFNLADACKLVLRAVDVDTGKGIPGVTFVMENLVGEYYALPINGDNLGAKKVSDLKHAALKTDKAGVFQRLIGPYPGWTYYVWRSPDEYEAVTRGEEVEIDTKLGTTRAAHMFKFRRKPSKQD